MPNMLASWDRNHLHSQHKWLFTKAVCICSWPSTLLYSWLSTLGSLGLSVSANVMSVSANVLVHIHALKMPNVLASWERNHVHAQHKWLITKTARICSWLSAIWLDTCCWLLAPACYRLLSTPMPGTSLKILAWPSHVRDQTCCSVPVAVLCVSGGCTWFFHPPHTLPPALVSLLTAYPTTVCLWNGNMKCQEGGPETVGFYWGWWPMDIKTFTPCWVNVDP